MTTDDYITDIRELRGIFADLYGCTADDVIGDARNEIARESDDRD